MKMKTLILAASAVMISWAGASVTLNFSAPPGVINGGFLGSGGELDGLTWGIVIDTGADGFAAWEPGIAPISGAVLTAGGDDLLWLAPGTTLNAFGQGGVITSVASIPIGANAGGSGLTTDPGQAFAIVWLDPGFSGAAGDLYGALPDAGFVLPPDGTTGGGFESNPILDDSLRPTSIEIVPETSSVLLGLIGFLGLLRRRR